MLECVRDLYDRVIVKRRVTHKLKDFIVQSDKLRNYYADFFINNDVLIEIKPKSMMNYNHNREKINAGKEYCKNMGYEYKVLTEEELKDLNKVL